MTAVGLARLAAGRSATSTPAPLDFLALAFGAALALASTSTLALALALALALGREADDWLELSEAGSEPELDADPELEPELELEGGALKLGRFSLGEAEGFGVVWAAPLATLAFAAALGAEGVFSEGAGSAITAFTTGASEDCSAEEDLAFLARVRGGGELELDNWQ